MQTKVRILGVDVDSVTMEQAIRRVEEMIQTGRSEGRSHVVATANAEMVMMSGEDRELAVILQQADLVVPDGAGVVWAARHLGSPVPERVAGFDLAQNLLQKSAARGYRVYLLGSAPGVAEKAASVARQKYPGVQIVGIQDGFFTQEQTNTIIEAIHHAKPDILLVALGVPKQEKWLKAHLTELAVPVAIGVGGTLDVMAGVMKRAPLWMQEANLEWLFRLMMQPKRLIRMLALPRFVLKVCAAKKD